MLHYHQSYTVKDGSYNNIDKFSTVIIHDPRYFTMWRQTIWGLVYI